MNPGGLRLVAWLAIAGCAGLLALEVLWNLRAALDVAWNDVLLAPAAAMMRGQALWFPDREGPELDMIYGPVSALAWVPAALQTTPTRAIGVGLLEAFLFAMLSMAWIVRTEARHHPTLAVAILLLATGYWVSTPVLPGLRIHPDAPALALGTVALACAWTEKRRRHVVWRWTGAAAVVAAAGAKQTLAPLLVAWPAWIALTSGWRTGGRAAGTIGVVGVGALALVATTLDVAAMLATTVIGLSRQPWIHANPVSALSEAALDLGRRALPAALLLAVAVPLVGRRAATWPETARENRWLFPLAMAIVFVPMALLGRVKVGGGVNTLAVSIWFLYIAMLAAFASAGRRTARIRHIVTAVAAVVAAALAIRAAPQLGSLPGLLRARPMPSQAFAAARQKPRTIYFLYRPTVNLLADGRADHFFVGIWFRELRGLAVDDEYLHAYLPPGMARVAIEPDRNRGIADALKRLPQFRRQILEPALPGWIVLTRDDLLAPGERPAPLHRVRRGVPDVLATEVVAVPGSPAGLTSAAISLPADGRTLLARLDAVLASPTRHTSLDLDVVLRDDANRHLLTLSATTGIQPGGEVVIEWRTLDELVQEAARAVVVVRGRREAGDDRAWRLSSEEVRSLPGFARAAP